MVNTDPFGPATAAPWAKTPVTRSEPSLLMTVNVLPTLIGPTDDTTRLAPVTSTAPVTFTWSYPVPAVVPTSSTFRFDPAARVRLPVPRTPGLDPGLTVPPPATVTGAAIDPD